MVAQRVEVRPEFRWIWRAWEALHDDRVQSVEGVAAPMGGTLIRTRPGRIPWTTVRFWATHEELTRAEMELLRICLRAMDDVYLRHWQRISRLPS